MLAHNHKRRILATIGGRSLSPDIEPARRKVHFVEDGLRLGQVEIDEHPVLTTLAFDLPAIPIRAGKGVVGSRRRVAISSLGHPGESRTWPPS